MKKTKKLTLSRETLRSLGDHQMAPVVGASGSPTCVEKTCGSCAGSCFQSCTCDMSCWGSCGSCDPTCPCV